MSNSTAQPGPDTLAAPNNNTTPHGLSQTEDVSAASNTQQPTQQSQPQSTAKSLQDVCADIHGRVQRFLSAPPTSETIRRSQDQTRVATMVIAQALEDYDFDSLSLSYNGGKDCLVLLILYLAVLHTYFTQPSGRRKEGAAGERAGAGEGDKTKDQGLPTSIPSIYAKPPDPFDSVTTFVESSTRDYHLDLVHISTNPGSKPKSKSHSSPPPTSDNTSQAAAAATVTTDITTTNEVANANGDIHGSQSTPKNVSSNEILAGSMTTTTSEPIVSFRDAFAMYLQAHPQIRAIFVGTRRTDPHGATLEHFQMTDGNWPRFMRIHPVIDWRLSEIWCFLKSEHLADPQTGLPLEYCSMYDAGYTSLGGMDDTLRNPMLKYTDKDGHVKYRPAHEMTEDEEERAGRE